MQLIRKRSYSVQPPRYIVSLTIISCAYELDRRCDRSGPNMDQQVLEQDFYLILRDN